MYKVLVLHLLSLVLFLDSFQPEASLLVQYFIPTFDEKLTLALRLL